MIGSARRYYAMKALTATEAGDGTLALYWRGRLDATPGTPLPPNFPFRDALVAHAYTMTQDLTGATHEELAHRLGISSREARAILVAAKGT